MKELEIPATPQDITPTWLTHALQSTGTLTNSVVISVNASPLEAGKGYTTQLARLSVSYDPPEPDAPLSLFCKLPTTHEETLSLAKRLGIYQREVRFYEQLADKVPIRTPQRYYSCYNSENGDFVLLLKI
ncbi:MAG: hypothetical protein O7F12_15965 [Nitrospirae bacterium]|nr:hypothetical protein [Nitrospirota bacterium]